MDDRFDAMAQVQKSMTEFHEELFELEETYLKRFGVYPTMPDLSQATLPFYVEKIKQCLSRDIMIEDL